MSTFAIIVSTIFRLTMVATIAIGISSGSGREKFLEEGTVSWRGLDFVFILLLMVSETYTSFSFLGTAGWSNSYGVPIFYLIGYLSIALIVAYLVGPLFWTYAARHKLISLSEIVEHRFRSRVLGSSSSCSRQSSSSPRHSTWSRACAVRHE